VQLRLLDGLGAIHGDRLDIFIELLHVTDRGLDDGLADGERELDAALGYWRMLSPPRQRVLISMCFQLGLKGLLGFKRMLAALEICWGLPESPTRGSIGSWNGMPLSTSSQVKIAS